MAVFPVEKTPLTIPGCRLWLDASDLSTITQSGGFVSLWKNKANNSNTGYFPIQSTGANQPSIGSPQEGLNTISFNGSSQSMQITDSSALNGPITIFAACSPTTTGILYVISKRSGSSNGGITLDSGRMFVFDSLGAASIAEASFSAVPLVFIGRASVQNGSYVEFAVNNTSFIQSGTTVTGFANASQPCQLGRRGDLAGGYYNGRMFEILVYSQALTDAQVTTINRYLSNKWGISL